MELYTSMLKVQGVWRKLLVVKSDVELDESVPEMEEKFIDEKGDEICNIYYIDEVYKSFKQDGMYWYWMLYSSDRMTVNGAPADDTIAALEVLGVQTEG